MAARSSLRLGWSCRTHRLCRTSTAGITWFADSVTHLGEVYIQDNGNMLKNHHLVGSERTCLWEPSLNSHRTFLSLQFRHAPLRRTILRAAFQSIPQEHVGVTLPQFRSEYSNLQHCLDQGSWGDEFHVCSRQRIETRCRVTYQRILS